MINFGKTYNYIFGEPKPSKTFNFPNYKKNGNLPPVFAMKWISGT
jgi:hypothetical protein